MPNKKMANLIYFILDELGEVPTVKLAKLLYYSDFLHYKKTHEAITKAKYRHLELGPCPATFEETLAELRDTGNVGFDERKYKGEEIYRVYKTHKTPDKKAFSKAELDTINDVLAMYGKKSGKQLVELTHNEFPWKATKPYDEIPYALAQYIGVPMEAEPEPEDEFFRNSDKLEKAVDSMKRTATRVKSGAAAV